MNKIVIEKNQDGKVLVISKFNENELILTKENKELNTIENHEYDKMGNEILFECPGVFKRVRTFIEGTNKLKTYKFYNPKDNLRTDIENIYDEKGNQIEYRNYIDNTVVKYLYNENEKLKRIDSLDGNYTDYEYNEKGKLLSCVTKINERIQRQTYDGNDHLIKTEINNIPVIECKYDERGNQIYVKNDRFERYSIYDENNHIIESNAVFNNNAEESIVKDIFKYDERGNKIYNKRNNVETNIKYDDQNREVYYENIENNDKKYWHETKYDEKGNEIYYKDSNDIISERKYDDDNNLIYDRNCERITYYEISYEE